MAAAPAHCHINCVQGVMNGTLRPGRPADCPREWVSLMERCWATQPSRRATFTEIADALDELVVKYDNAE